MTRWRISAAAFRVKVMATTASGCSTCPSSVRNRWMSNSVFPEPAGAWTMYDRVGSSACRRCFRSWTWSIMAALRLGSSLSDPAECRQRAMPAGLTGVSWGPRRLVLPLKSRPSRSRTSRHSSIVGPSSCWPSGTRTPGTISSEQASPRKAELTGLEPAEEDTRHRSRRRSQRRWAVAVHRAWSRPNRMACTRRSYSPE